MEKEGDYEMLNSVNFSVSEYVTNLTTFNLEMNESYGMMPIYGYVLSAIFLFIVWFFGSTGNILVMYLFYKNKQLQTPMNFLILNLSATDLLTSALGSPIAFFASVLGKWPYGARVCVMYGFGMALGGIGSITTLMLLAFERFLMIARPFRAADIKTHHSIAFIVLIWTYSLTLTIPPLIGWASYGPEAAYISCSVNWESNNLSTTSYIVFLFVMGLVLPLLTIMFSYIGILLTIRKTNQLSSSVTSSVRRAEGRIVAMVFVMVTSFILAWAPYAIVSLIMAFFPRYKITGFAAVLPSIFAKSSSCYNPIIYVVLNTQFQTAWRKLLGRQEPRDADEASQSVTMSQQLTQRDKWNDGSPMQSGKIGEKTNQMDVSVAACCNKIKNSTPPAENENQETTSLLREKCFSETQI